MTGKNMDSKEKEKGTCNYERDIGEPCGRPLYDDEHCIFHSKDIENKKEKFNEQFREEFDRQKEHEEKFNFKGFIFPGDISFKGITFEKDVEFSQAQFSGDAYFEVVKFSGTAFFRAAQFSGGAYFGRSQFAGWALFNSAKFSNAAPFWDAEFSDRADFCGVQFLGTVFFNAAQFRLAANFSTSQFSGETIFSRAQFYEEVKFNNAKFLETADLTYMELKKYNKCEMSDTYFYNILGLEEFIEKNKKQFKYSNKTEFLPDNFLLKLGEESLVHLPIISRKIKDDMYLLSFKKKHPKMHFLWWLFADCGRSLLRWALWSILFAVLFAYVFFSMGPDAFTINSQLPYSGVTMLYYSVVTFTTLGFGDVIPNRIDAGMIVMLEVILGYIMLGGLISILANKLARRS
jgi:uncharacterized protein YjbI with pentapeptide repeats